MRSSTGAYFIALDHVRALAAFLVFTWHFIHRETGFPIPYEGAPVIFPLAILDEGHTGVALFMTLSGYLFSKLLADRKIDYLAFLQNRALRLLPLLVVVVLYIGFRKTLAGGDIVEYVVAIAKGVVLPTLPNGGWSITAEFHFYLILPLLLWAARINPLWLLGILAAAIAVRCAMYTAGNEVRIVSYWSIIGRIDQFLLGIIAARYHRLMTGRHVTMLLLFVAFSGFYWAFDASGGFYRSLIHPAPSPVWIVLPTIEGAFYAAAIAWYESSFSLTRAGVSGFIARLGQFSYSIYLLHYFIVFKAAAFVHARIMDISNFYLAVLWSAALFPLMLIPATVSYRYIEEPFLKLRTRYLRDRTTSVTPTNMLLRAESGD